MGAIRLHKEHGLNPTIPVCFFCGKEKNELILLGAKSKQITGEEKAPMRMCFDTTPCDECKAFMKKGVIIISVRNGETDKENPYRTGRYFVVTDEFVKKAFTGKMKTDVLKRRICFIEDETLDNLGFPSKEEACQKQE